MHRASEGSFGCSRCGAPLELERVVSADAERKGAAVTGYVLFRHSCACAPGERVSTRSWSTHALFCDLFGGQPWLPYCGPFEYVPVADDHPIATRWRWELDQVADVAEFLLFVDDAHVRRNPT